MGGAVGDFVNGAQNIIDQFIVSAESKWHRTSGIVLLLPHGYEGQGPEHSSARLERFLQSCAEENIQVCNVTTPAQYFHLLRRQMRREFVKPLVLMTPKSLLRHPRRATHRWPSWPRAGSGPCSTTRGRPRRVRRVIVCAGKIFHALDAARAEAGRAEVALVRVEQLYPFPAAELGDRARALCERGGGLLGAGGAGQPGRLGVRAPADLRPAAEVRFSYIGRDEAASPATGLYPIHQAEERAILEQALEG